VRRVSQRIRRAFARDNTHAFRARIAARTQEYSGADVGACELGAPRSGRHRAPSAEALLTFSASCWRRNGSDSVHPRCPATVGPRIGGRADSSFGANHRVLSRPPSRRQPFRFGRRDHYEKSVERFIKFSRRLRVEFTAGSTRLTVLARGANTFSAVASPGGRHSAPPEDDGLQPARRSAVVPRARRAPVVFFDQDKSSTQTNPGGTPRAEGCSPPVFPLDTLVLTATRVVGVR
jgi:hypothetical protein